MTRPASRSTTRVAPAVLERGSGATAAVGRHAAAFGSRAAVVHGTAGFEPVWATVRASVDEVGVTATEATHEGPVTQASIARLTVQARGAEVLVAVGGGRVLDAGKAAAHELDIPVITVPTSPATCAAVTAMCVLYDDRNVWAGPLQLLRPPDVTLLDTDVLASAPDRLLAAGVLDALAKVEEVRLAARHAVPGDPLLASALALCDVLAEHVEPSTGALAGGLSPDPAARAALAEAVIVLPGLVAGLAGEGNKLAVAHAVHNAFTLLPGHDVALHGELVGFGVLVQRALLGAEEAELTSMARWMQGLGVRLSLEALGCAEFETQQSMILEAVRTAPAVQGVIQFVDAEGVARAVQLVERATVGASDIPTCRSN